MRTHLRHLAALLAFAVMFAAACNPPPAEAGTTVPAPANVQVNNLSHTSVGLIWEGPPRVPYSTEHRIEYHEAGHPGDVQSVDPGIHQTLDGRWTGAVFLLEPDTTYVFQVIRIEDGVESAPSEPLTVTTLAPAPTDLNVREVINGSSTSTAHLGYVCQSDELYRVYWNEAASPGDRESEDVSCTQSYPNPRPPGVNAIVSGLAQSTTYVFEVVHVDGNGDESEPSNQVTLQTGPYDTPQVAVGIDGDLVTLTWERPPHQSGPIIYDVYDNDVFETRIRTEDEQPQVTISRPTSGVTHSYTIDGEQWGGELTDPVTVTVPPSADTTPPTEPVVVFGPDCDTFEDTIRIEVQSTDDTSPQSEIKYEALKWAYIDYPNREWYVADYDFPLVAEGIGSDIQVRAVDEAGNRSAPVTPEEVIPDC